ncbi:hypothetical protein [Gilvimarinus sp. DA14]|uniref:hypothetical protein n=1 Tax=Gilvimarinus sp. DA14 TaxID=2956798 RepID=UPI0020B6E6E6|nr:hypothetical protein [Gilvimarinus sp. DA14]UTF60848.1 hypothetical protein NHM04_03330 [Gilvimarinus sp. DA14]
MKKLLLTSVLPLAALVSTSASATPDTDSLKLEGKIDYQCTLTLSGQNGSSVNLVIGQQSVGNFAVICNDPDGFEVSVTSANGSNLQDDGGNYSAPYKMKFTPNANQPSVSLFSGGWEALDVSDQVNGFVADFADADGAAYGMMFKIDDGFNNALPGGVALKDTVTFSIDGL